jgi:type VI secretion system secreted protein Hcp
MANEIFVKISLVDEDGEIEEVVTEEACSEDSIGSYEKPNHSEEAYVIGVNHKVSIPRDDRTGHITGNPRLGFLEILKLIDRSSPLLKGILVSPKKLEVELSFYRAEDLEEPYYSITLKNARVIGMRPFSPDVMDPANDTLLAAEYVKLSYESIEWEHNICSTNASYSSLG